MIMRPLDANTVRVRWLLLNAVKPYHLSFWRSMLDEDELGRADKFHFSIDRETFTAAHALMRAMLSEATGEPGTALNFTSGQHGRPELASSYPTGKLRFNISHTRGLVA